MSRTRVGQVVAGIPDEEQVAPEERECPPHNFEAGWATPADGGKDHEDTIPALYCKACGDVRAFRILD